MKRDDASLIDIVVACRKLLEITAGRTEDDLKTDDLLRFAALYLIATIGEAAYRLSDEFCANNSDVPWGEIRGMRNRVIHGYDQINLSIVWLVTNEKAPQLMERLEPLLPAKPETT
jgi:uncharacterized protein with HEPN domain